MSVDLPEPYGAWIQAAAGAIPSESRVNCLDCTMCDPATTRATVTFDATMKCCTYLPEIPNFLVGRILSDDTPANAQGRASVVRRIEDGAGVTPLLLGRSAPVAARFDAAGEYMGVRTDLACPHLDGEGGCGIRPHRHAVCATWFCKHERGAEGQELWALIRELLLAVEHELSVWAAMQEGLSDAALRMCLGTPGAERVVPDRGASRAPWWGDLLGDELGFYERCAGRVAGLDWDDVLRITGPVVSARASVVRQRAEAYRQPTVPARLAVGQHSVIAVGVHGTLVRTHSPFDPLGLPAALVSVLHYFDGRPTAEVLEQLHTERGVVIADDLLRHLLDWRVLREG